MKTTKLIAAALAAMMITTAPAPGYAEPLQSNSRGQFLGGCGFGSYVVKTINSKAKTALQAAAPERSYDNVFSGIISTTYRDVMEWAGVYATEKGGASALDDLDPIPGLKPDIAIEGASQKMIPLVSFDNGVQTLTKALASAQKKDPEGFKKCFPDVVELADNYDAKVAEVVQKRQEAAAQAAAAAARAAAVEAERRSPHGRVTEGYALYRLVRFCNEVRRGYLVQYVNDDELARATTAIQAIVRKAKNDEPGIDTDALWYRSAELIRRGRDFYANAEACQGELGALLRMSPVALYDDSKPLD
jgi:hypothetical protein